MEVASISHPSELHQKGTLKFTSIFRVSKLRQKERRKDVDFCLYWRIDETSTWNRRRFEVLCPLGKI